MGKPVPQLFFYLCLLGVFAGKILIHRKGAKGAKKEDGHKKAQKAQKRDCGLRLSGSDALICWRGVLPAFLRTLCFFVATLFVHLAGFNPA
jgi:hypothetical protein